MKRSMKCIKNVISVLLVILLVMTSGTITMLVSIGLDTLIHRANADDEENAVLVEGEWKNSLNQDVRYTITKQGVMKVFLADSSQQGPMDMVDTPGKMKADISGEQPYYAHKDYIKEVVISYGITEIGDRAFEGKSYTNHADREGFDAFMSITKVSCANNTTLKRIGIAAFQNCQNVVEVDLSGCSSLEEIAGKDAKNAEDPTWSEGENLNPYEATGAYGYVEEGAFSDCIKLVAVNVAGCTSLKTVGDGAFHNGKAQNTFLSQFDFEDLTSLEVIGVAAFKDNKTKNTIDFTRFEDIRVIDSMAFRSNVGVVTVDLSGRTSLTRLGAEAFYQAGVAATIKSVDLSGCTGLTVIETKVFANSSSGEIESVNLSGCINITEIKKYAFQNQKKLTHIDIPEGVTLIDKDAFSNCTSLKSVTWNAVNYSTSNSAKYLFPRLEELFIGPDVTELPEKFFANLSLDSVSIAFAPRSENQTIRMKFPFGSNIDTRNNVLEYTIDENGYVWYDGVVVFPPEEIRNNPMNLVPPTPRQLVYNGSEQSLIDEANPGRVSAGSRIEFRVNDDTDWSTALPKATNAGTYKIYYRAVNETDTTIITEGNTPVITTIGKIKNPVNVDESEVSVSQGDTIDFSSRILSNLPAETTSIKYAINDNNGGTINAKTGVYKTGNNAIPGSYYITITFGASINYNETIIRIPLVVGGGTVKVTFNKNSGDGNFPTQTINIGEAATEPSNIPTRLGYHFDYWYLSLFNGNNVSATNNGQAYDFSTLLISSITLTAHWTPIKYTIEFDSNGGTGSMEPQKFDYGTYKNLTANSFSKDNCIFLGWSTVADGDVVYSDKESVGNIAYIEGDTITLYAKWGEFIVTMSESVVYDGQAHSVYVAADASTALEYRIDGSDEWLSENPTFIKVGDHKVYVRATFVTGKQLTYNGTLSITQKPVTITAASDAWTYDGSAHSNTTVTVTSGSLLTGDSLVATATGSVTNVADTRDGNNTVDAGYMIMHGNEEVTANYVITTVAGTLTINPKAVTITAQNKTFTYNGTAQSWPEYEVVGLVGNDAITADVIGNITFPSQSPVSNEVSGFSFTSGTPENYYITREKGQLIMTNAEVAITITAASDAWTYDGSAHSNTTVTVTSGSLLTGDSLVATATGSVTNVADTRDGNNPVDAGYKIMHGTEDVTANYVITTVAGKLTINPKDVTVTAQDKAFTYNGTAQSWPEYDVVGLVGDDALSAVLTGSITFPSESPVTNELTGYEFKTGEPGNYNVTTANGQLTMTRASVEITITGASQAWTYDGVSHSNTTVTVTSGSLLTGDSLVATATGSVTNVADTRNGNNSVAAGYKIMHGTEDVTANYIITANAGTLSIHKRPITLKANDASNEYIGREITYATATDAAAPYFTVSNTSENEGLAPGQSITSIELTGNGTAVNEYTIKITPGSVNIGNYTSNYNISLESGTLSITKNTTAITVTPGSDSKVYDGTPLTKNEHDAFTVTGVPEGFTWTAKANGTVTNVTPGEGEKSENAVTEFKIFNANGEDVTDWFSNIDTSATGTLEITKRVVTLTSESAEKPYDGSSLTKPGVMVSGDGFVAGEVSEIMATGSVTTVAEGEVTNTIIFSEGASFKADNYSITKKEGTLKITANMRTVVINSSSKSWTYDGQTHTDEVYTVTYDGTACTADASGKVFTLSTGDTVTITATADGVKDYNSSYNENNTYTYVLTNGSSYSNVTANNGTLAITKRNVTLTSEDDVKIYDGTPLTSQNVTVGGDGFVAGEVSEIKATGSVTTVAEGEVTNTIAFTEGASFKAENYSITKNEGTLKITANMRTVVITSSSRSWTYDGQTHTDEVYTVTYDGTACTADASGKVFTLPIGDTLTITPTAEGVKDYNSSLDENNTYLYSITNANSYGDVTANYGTLSITKCSVTIKADNKSKVYDKDAATDPELSATVTGVVSGDTINYTLSRADGQNVGEYAITVTSGNNPNYDVTVEAGTFSITAKEAALTWSDTEFPYDGKSHAPVATVSNLADGDTCEVTVDGAQTKIGDAYTANATALSNPNYKLPADASTKFKIYGCTITFVDEDGTELQSSVVEYGTKPSYTGKTPEKAATAQYSYEFLDWSPTITEVTGDKTYTATYKPILNAYTVTWKDEDGTILETDKDVPYGTVPTYDGKEPTKAATAEYSFKFDGWSIKVAEVTGDITYTATYAKSAIEYTVEAENLPEGTQLSFSGTETVEAGKVLTFKVLLADGYEASDDLVVTVNGTKIAPNADGSYTIPSVMTNSVISVTGVVKVDYNLTEGENAEYKQGDSKNARFVFKRTVNDKVTFGRFTYAELDGKLLDPNNYTKVSGSLILELKKDFLDTLPVGEHLLKVYFSDDKEGVIAHFLISAGITPTVTVTVTPAPDSNPTTGDTSNPILWIILIGAAVLGLAGMIYSRSRMER